MPRVIVGYGEYEGYRLAELPSKALEDLGKRYPLIIDEQLSAEYSELVITLAVHAELRRRGEGGPQACRVPTMRELAQEIVTKGYHRASEHHHPDGRGNHDSQVLLNQARDELRKAANNFAHYSEDESATIIPPPLVPRARATATPVGLTDDDVPF